MKRALLLVSLCAVLMAPVVFADPTSVWRYAIEDRVCPIYRLGTGASERPLSLDYIAAISPMPSEFETDVIKDPPTRAGFLTDGQFACCFTTLHEAELCEVTDLSTGAFHLQTSNAETAVELMLDEIGNWPTPDIYLSWSEAVDEWSTSLLMRLRARDVSQILYEINIAEPGSLVLWGVRSTPDGQHIAVLHHAYFGENSDRFPVVLVPIRASLRRFFEHAARVRPDKADHFKARAKGFSPSTD